MTYRSTRSKVLLIDDDLTFNLLFEKSARVYDWDCQTATSLLELGSFARIREFDLAVIDFHMDTLQGDEVASYVDMFFAEVPVVMISSSPLTKQQRQSWPPCVRRFVRKDEGLPKLFERLDEILQRQKWLLEVAGGSRSATPAGL